MKNAIALLLTLAACGGNDSTGTVNDPRAVSCGEFRADGYKQKLPQSRCYFDASDLDWDNSPFPLPPGGEPRPQVIGGYCGENCSVNNSATPLGGEQFRAGTIEWTGDIELGIAVQVGEWSADRCIWKRCLRVE